MHDALFENQTRLNSLAIFLIEEELQLPETALRKAVETGQYRNKVRSDCFGGVRSGVNGTPIFFINGIRQRRLYFSHGGDSSAPRRRYQGVTRPQNRQSIDWSFG